MRIKAADRISEFLDGYIAHAVSGAIMGNLIFAAILGLHSCGATPPPIKAVVAIIDEACVVISGELDAGDLHKACEDAKPIIAMMAKQRDGGFHDGAVHDGAGE